MNPNLTDLRSLLAKALTHASNPAIQRIPKKARTVNGLARYYLSWGTCWFDSDGPRSVDDTEEVLRGEWSSASVTSDLTADLRDPGTARAFLVALALYLGLDPGEGALTLRWWRVSSAWSIDAGEGGAFFLSSDGWKTVQSMERWEMEIFGARLLDRHVRLLAPDVANENNPINALALATQHVLKGEL